MGTINHITSGTELRAWRGRLGWSQSRAAAELRVIAPSIRNLESGRRAASGTLLRLAEVLELIAGMGLSITSTVIAPVDEITPTETEPAQEITPATPAAAADLVDPTAPAAPVPDVVWRPARRSSLAFMPVPVDDEPDRGVTPPAPVDELHASVLLNAEELGYAVHGVAATMLVDAVRTIRTERHAPHRSEENRQAARRADADLELQWREVRGTLRVGLAELADVIDVAAD